jgi:hypothetical protein
VRVRAEARVFIASLRAAGHSALLHDLEAEVSYMRVREARPRRVLEMSPYCGYSSFWLLAAVRDNGGTGDARGRVDAFDLIDCAARTLPASMTTDPSDGFRRWTLHQGDALELVPRALDAEEEAAAAAAAAVAANAAAQGQGQGYPGEQPAPSGSSLGYDYLFIDSEHSPSFAIRYINLLLERHHRGRPMLSGSVHDIFIEKGITEEGVVLVSWLAEKQSWRRLLSVSPFKAPRLYVNVMRLRAALGISRRGATENLLECGPSFCCNSMVFLDLVNAGASGGAAVGGARLPLLFHGMLNGERLTIGGAGVEVEAEAGQAGLAGQDADFQCTGAGCSPGHYAPENGEM